MVVLNLRVIKKNLLISTNHINYTMLQNLIYKNLFWF
jgi:hypothetical protein